MRTIFIIMFSALLIVPSACADDNNKRAEKQKNAYKLFFAQVYETLEDTPGHIFSPELVIKSGRKFRIGFSSEGKNFTVNYNFNVPGGLQIMVRIQGEREQKVTIVDKNLDGEVDEGFYGWSRDSTSEKRLKEGNKATFQALFQDAMVGISEKLHEHRREK